MYKLTDIVMKKVFYLLACHLIAASSVFADDMQTEKRTVIYTPAAGEKVCLLMPGGSLTRHVSFAEPSCRVRRMLRVVGEVQMPAPYTDRGEGAFRWAEFLIDDNLDSIHVKRDKYSLYFKGEDDEFERHAYYRISAGLLKPGNLTVTLPVVRRKDLSVSPGGDFGVEIELFYNKPGRHKDDIYDTPDSLLYLPVPEGSGKFSDVSETFTLPEGIACAFLRVGGTHFKGECWVEAPRLTQNKKAVCSIPFLKHEARTNDYNYWVGCNLSTRSWPRWRVDFAGTTVFEGNIFDRASMVADFYIPLPETVCGEGDLTLTLLKEDNRAAFPYELRSMEILEENARDFEIVSVPKYVSVGAAFGVLVETNRPNVRLKVESTSAVSPSSEEVEFKETGLHVVEFRAGSHASAVPMTFSDGSRKASAVIRQIVEKAPDEVYISSGDEIYIPKDIAMYDYFFKWYVSHRIGNWYQFRPSYQWCGTRVAHPEMIRRYTTLLTALQMPYAWQVEGRTLAGKRINPDLATLASPMFRGKQAHENDGGYYYWQHFLYQGVFSDMAARNRPYGGIFAKHRPIYTDHGVFIHYDTQGVKDMADGARRLVENFRYSKGESTRHTGPSTMFRYLYQAGYDWLGAEQMYGPEETILSSLRGASRAYSKPFYGSLHAMQWGSGPFTDPKHSLRLYMSLAVAYMHGSSHMNTEEALWTDEYVNDRYSTSGKEHLDAQHRIFDFIETHTRRGELHSNIAILQGRNDAWKSFGRGSLWSQKGEKWAFNKATESFDLLKVFYPGNNINACGPEGWFTSTPYGTVDILPIEAPQDVMNKYKAIAFLGWNSFDADDFLRLRNYVFGGGTLILSAAHLNAELQPDQPTQFPAGDAILREMLGEGYRLLTRKTEIPFGLGKIIYFPEASYPAETSLRSQYEETLRSVATAATDRERAKGWIESSPSIGFTVWDEADRRTIYLLNTDWKSEDESHKATFVCGDKRFPIDVRRYHIETIHFAEGLAVVPESNTTDILSIMKVDAGWQLTVQNTEKDTIRCFSSATGAVKTITLDAPSVHVITVDVEN